MTDTVSDEMFVRDRFPQIDVANLDENRISICLGRDCLAQGVPSEAWAAAATHIREQRWWYA